MPSSSYAKGYLAENEAVHILKNMGLQARREFRSGNNWFGKFYPRGDIIATHPKIGFLFFEIKRWAKRKTPYVKIEKEEISKLIEWIDFFHNASENKEIKTKLLIAIRFPLKKWCVKEIKLDNSKIEKIRVKEEESIKDGLSLYIAKLLKHK